MKKLFVILIAGFLLYGFIEENPGLIQSYFPGNTFDTTDSPGSTSSTDSQQVTRAFEKRQSDVQVAGTGIVESILADDREGSRHQRFILRLSSGQTLLVAHNIDLAPRIDSLRKGDTVAFYGEYIWNSKGGVLHWTHHDPGRRHQAGWLKHQGETYQ